MAKIDEVKEFIGFLKAIFITLIVINTSLIAFLYKDNGTLLFQIIILFIIITLSIIIILLFSKILKEIRKLRDL